MIRNVLLRHLAVALLLCAGAAQAKPAHHAAPKTPAPQLDGANPASLIAIFQAGGLKAQIAKRDADSVLVTATSPEAAFSVQFVQCDPQGRGCKAALFDSESVGAPTLVQINDYNQASALCRGYMDRSGKAHVTMPLLLFPDESRTHLVTAVYAWGSCVGDFANFARNPVGYLAAAP
jgi:hypothetical protein